jgi:hypothetical protein
LIISLLVVVEQVQTNQVIPQALAAAAALVV